MEIEISETLTRQLTPKCKAMLGLPIDNEIREIELRVDL